MTTDFDKIERAVCSVIGTDTSCLADSNIIDRLSCDSRGFVFYILHKKCGVKIKDIQSRYGLARRTVFHNISVASSLISLYRRYQLAYAEMLSRCGISQGTP